jgi:hypothetical protein
MTAGRLNRRICLGANIFAVPPPARLLQPPRTIHPRFPRPRTRFHSDINQFACRPARAAGLLPKPSNFICPNAHSNTLCGSAPEPGRGLPCLFERGASTVPGRRGCEQVRRPLLWPKGIRNTIFLHIPINAMKEYSHHLKLGGILGLPVAQPRYAGTVAQDTSAKLIQNPRILYSSTVRHADGGTTTYQRIEPPTAAQLAALQPAPQVSFDTCRILCRQS